MNACVAREAKTDQVVERVIRLILVDMVDVNKRLAVLCRAYLARRAVALPRGPRSFVVPVGQVCTFLPWAFPADALQSLLISRVAANRCLSMGGAELRPIHARLPAVEANSVTAALLTPFFHSGSIPGKTGGTHCSPNKYGRCAAGAFVVGVATDLPNAVLVGIQQERNRFDGSPFLQKFNNSLFINRLCSHLALLCRLILTGHASESNMDIMPTGYRITR